MLFASVSNRLISHTVTSVSKKKKKTKQKRKYLVPLVYCSLVLIQCSNVM